ncbi:peroxiredoxin [Gloeobacter kilaueensis]|uniref:thioredoxin-dependent peroxiredoxin n=1 Tax=Gloeobacter kilaueensis (strain ATCC BAA-2537 / CCAP 1431/1 / ULC 316 / JS1) TaxID=1183438 RepID=U5QCH9_GLOK1|nr:peroxiredoxin [Gloeobacter kilaueensis]AGY56622.1 bacterioferritin comigratory protein [Gloeobacter kilaueensis JS1]
MYKKRFLSLALALALSPLTPLLAAPEPGQPAPDFVLPVAADKSVSLKDFRGRWLVLYFYPKDMTRGCTIEAQRFQRDLSQYKQLNTEVLGVSADALDSHSLFSKKEGLTFPLASDVGGKTARAYDSWYGTGDVGRASRNTYLIDPTGRIAKVFTGVDPTGHSEEVLAALKQAQVEAKAR